MEIKNKEGRVIHESVQFKQYREPDLRDGSYFRRSRYTLGACCCVILIGRNRAASQHKAALRKIKQETNDGGDCEHERSERNSNNTYSVTSGQALARVLASHV